MPRTAHRSSMMGAWTSRGDAVPVLRAPSAPRRDHRGIGRTAFPARWISDPVRATGPLGATPRLKSTARGPAVWLLDLDGVLTDTAAIHVEAWKAVFDAFLSTTGMGPEASRPFDPVDDYVAYVDGKPHADGVRDFLASRGIVLPEGRTSSDRAMASVESLARTKNDLYLQLLATRGARLFDGSLELLDALRAAGRRIAVVSASENCGAVLAAAGIADRFDAQVDGVAAKEHHLRGKPAPDSYLFAAHALAASPDEAAVVEDAVSGVVAGRSGHFGLVVGVARIATPGELRAAGADIVVADLAELLDPGAAADAVGGTSP